MTINKKMKNPSITTYDNELSNIEHYRKYPKMMPFIGSGYGSQRTKLLLIGESHYFPKDSNKHEDANAWYGDEITQESLSSSPGGEQASIHTRGVVECDWEKDMDSKFFTKINECLESLHIPCSERAISHIAFMNAFQRPAKHGKTFCKNWCTDTDIKNSAEVIDKVVSIIKPKVVIFVSKCAWDTFGDKLKAIHTNTKFDWVYHPTGRNGEWWKKGGGEKKFKELILLTL